MIEREGPDATLDHGRTAGAKLPGKVYLIGAGPGAPDLLTVRAVRLLAEADMLFFDALVNPEVVALATGADKISVGKRCGKHSTAQRFINKRLVDAAQTHSVVVRLKGGDPMLFGRAQEEIDALREAGIECEVVPGVTAALAASADIGVSLTRRAISRSVVFATPRVGENESASDWMASVMAADTGVLYMAAGEAAELAQQLIARGKPADLPVAIVKDASLTQVEARYMTLAVLAEGLTYDGRPAILLLGEVYREALERSLQQGDESDESVWPIAINQPQRSKT